MFQNLNFEALKLEYGVEYANPTFADMRQYYVDPCDARWNFRAFTIDVLANIHILKPLMRCMPVGILKNIILFDRKGQDIDLTNLIKNDRKIYVRGWHFRIEHLVNKHADELRRKYTLKTEFYAGNELIGELLQMKKIICILEIRRLSLACILEEAIIYVGKTENIFSMMIFIKNIWRRCKIILRDIIRDVYL